MERELEIRRHSRTKKGPGRGQGSHLSSDGVRLAREVGAAMGQFDIVVTSALPRSMETAIAMGYAVDESLESLCPTDAEWYSEIGHHERWSWKEPFVTFARLVKNGGSTTRLGEMQKETWASIASELSHGGRALVISHGRVIESGLVACFPDAEYASWGPPFLHCEGVRLFSIDDEWKRVDFLRYPSGG